MSEHSKSSAKSEVVENAEGHSSRPKCGIVMPISEIDGCSDAHWKDVLKVLMSAANDAGFDADIVSNSNEIGIIQDSIVRNLYENDIVICDVSCKNPNVMFELGMRLAFDKPTVIVKDDKTGYSFDTSPVRHLEYPRDLHHFKLMDFKSDLVLKMQNSMDLSKKDKDYSPFLKHFGNFRVAKIEEKEVSGQDYIIKKLDSLAVKMNSLEGYVNSSERERVNYLKLSENSRLQAKPKILGELNDIIIYLSEKSNAADMESFIEDVKSNLRNVDVHYRIGGGKKMVYMSGSAADIKFSLDYIKTIHGKIVERIEKM